MRKSVRSLLITVVVLIALLSLSFSVGAFPGSGGGSGGGMMGAGHPAVDGSDAKSDEPVPSTPLPKVDKIWVGIKNTNGDSLASMVMIPGKLYPLAITGLTLRATDFYSHWMIKKTAVNYSKEEKNPAIKIEVLKGDSVLYTRWAFKNIPFFGMNNMMGHSGSAPNQYFFSLEKYEGVRW